MVELKWKLPDAGGRQVVLQLLSDKFADVARVAQQPRVTLVHDEARSYLTRTAERFDVVQMSLIDTWAATTAGSMTLSENGLYTLEAWDAILNVLKPTCHIIHFEHRDRLIIAAGHVHMVAVWAENRMVHLVLVPHQIVEHSVCCQK